MSRASDFLQEFDVDKAADKMVANIAKRSKEPMDAKKKASLKAKFVKNMQKMQAKKKEKKSESTDEKKHKEDLNMLGKIPTRVHKMVQLKAKREKKAKEFLKKVKGK